MVEGAPHMAKRSMINCCLYGVPPAPVYIGARGRRCDQARGVPGGVLLPSGVGLPPFLVGIGFARWEQREKEGGAGSLSPCPIRTKGGGARGPALAASPLLPLRPIKAHVPPGGFR